MNAAKCRLFANEGQHLSVPNSTAQGPVDDDGLQLGRGHERADAQFLEPLMPLQNGKRAPLLRGPASTRLAESGGLAHAPN